jgi:hypothetical protein
MEEGARINVVGNTGGDDGEDVGGSLAADIEPGKKPVFPFMRSSA